MTAATTLREAAAPPAPQAVPPMLRRPWLSAGARVVAIGR